jgi:hypothetical protein
MIRALVLALALLLGGCGTLKEMVAPADLPVSEKLSKSEQIVQSAINEANILLASVADVTVEYVADGYMTKVEGRAYYDTLRDWEKKIIAAQKLMDAGFALDAKTEADLINAGLTALHKEILKRKAAQ